MIPPDQDSQLQKNSISSVASLISATINETVYLYGGEIGRGDYNKNIWAISAKDISANIPPTLLSARQNEIAVDRYLNFAPSGGVILNNSILTFCSNSSSNNLNITTTSNNVTNYLSVCSINLSDKSKNNNWSIAPLFSSLTPIARKESSVVVAIDKRAMYLLGGEQIIGNNTMSLQSNENDFWVYSIESQLWKRLISPFSNNLSRCGHTSTMLR